MEKINLIVDAGKANLEQLSTKINSLGFNVNEIQKEINEKTKEFSGLKVNVTLILDKENKKYEIKVKAPSVADLVKKELGVELLKISEEDKQKGKTVIGNLSMKQVEHEVLPEAIKLIVENELRIVGRKVLIRREDDA